MRGRLLTYQSLTIEEHADEDSAVAAYSLDAARPTFCSLNAYTWPRSAWAFARDKNLPVSCVDNCWIRIAVDAPRLRDFLNTGILADPSVKELFGRIREDRWYVINEEEF